MDMRTIAERLSSPIGPPAGRGDRAVAESLCAPGMPPARPAAVLVAVCAGRGPRGEPTVPMIKKRADLRVHAGEMSFPGGKPEPRDADLLDTALRETREEIGLPVARRQVVGQLDPVSTAGTGFVILPFVAAVGRAPGGARGGAFAGPLRAARGEVDEIIEFPLARLLGTMSPDGDPSHRSALHEGLSFSLGGRTVWGASARILGQVARRLGAAPPGLGAPAPRRPV